LPDGDDLISEIKKKIVPDSQTAMGAIFDYNAARLGRQGSDWGRQEFGIEGYP